MKHGVRGLKWVHTHGLESRSVWCHDLRERLMEFPRLRSGLHLLREFRFATNGLCLNFRVCLRQLFASAWLPGLGRFELRRWRLGLIALRRRRRSYRLRCFFRRFGDGGFCLLRRFSGGGGCFGFEAAVLVALACASRPVLSISSSIWRSCFRNLASASGVRTSARSA
jgi:hypothetical protein